MKSKKDNSNQQPIDNVKKIRKNPNKIELELSEKLLPKKPYKNNDKSRMSKKLNIFPKTFAKLKTGCHLTA
ncbi:MAG: hypothetical protein ABH841_03045 [Candidatus Nealsonbacteria bacterium]